MTDHIVDANEKAPQLFARVPVRWEEHPQYSRLMMPDGFKNIGAVILLGGTWTAFANGDVLGDSYPTPDAARRAVEEYWGVTTNPKGTNE